MPGRLSLYSKRDCPLCDEAAAVLRSLAPEFGLAVDEVDIESVPALWERYRYLVPVVALSPEANPPPAGDGEVLLYPPITESRLREALAHRPRPGSPLRGGV